MVHDGRKHSENSVQRLRCGYWASGVGRVLRRKLRSNSILSMVEQRALCVDQRMFDKVLNCLNEFVNRTTRHLYEATCRTQTAESKSIIAVPIMTNIDQPEGICGASLCEQAR